VIDHVIKAENLGKKYAIAHQMKAAPATLREALARGGANLWNRLSGRRDSAAKPSYEEFWALRDVSFEVRRGEVLGIIGPNGAGKSTLLKLLSRITEPTTGRITLQGRIASLLEVGTGFHPELTGRENIFLNGAILGMPASYIRRKFDEIVDFADIERFLDTPLKHYSSGMYARLAFAVAAHLEPDILIVDEVLAVGDAKFQRKCLGRMDKVAGEGRTVLFVSHNLQAVESVCRRGLVLGHGRVCFNGTQLEALDFYLKGMEPADIRLEDRTDRLGDGSVRVTSIELRNARGESVECVRTGESAEVRLYFHSTPEAPKSEIVVALNVRSAYDFPLFLHSSRFSRTAFGPLPKNGCFVCTIPRVPLVPGRYPVTYSVMPSWGRKAEYCDYIRHAFELEVRHGDYYGTGELPLSTHAVAVLDASWSLEKT